MRNPAWLLASANHVTPPSLAYRLGPCMLLSALAACSYKQPGLVKVEPAPGFSRVACYGGAGLPYSLNDAFDKSDTPPRPDPEDKWRNAWVVVDSASPSASGKVAANTNWSATFLYNGIAHPAKLERHGDSVFARSDTVYGYHGTWKWISHDSAAVTIKTTNLVTEWALHRVGVDLRGAISETQPMEKWNTDRELQTALTNNVDAVKTSPVWLVPISCAGVPSDAVIR